MPITQTVVHRENLLKGATLSEAEVRGRNTAKSCPKRGFLAP